DSVVDFWNTAQISAVRSNVKRADDDSKLVIEVEGADHVETIEAWERASCLDVTVMEMPSRISTILSAGECKSIDDMRARIAQLRQVLAP
ncbi:MAG: hypothetical protein ABIQ44_12660, partial [Chloroflexia bacterium]